MAFIDSWRELTVPENQLALTWIGQAGFLIKTASSTIVIDPYLTDSVDHQLRREHGDGFKRLAPALFAPADLVADYVFCSHEHGDHLDTEAICPLLDHPPTRLFINAAGRQIALNEGVPAQKIQTVARGESLRFGDFRVTALPADHGDLAPDALGFLFDFGFYTIYYSGDTAYNPDLLQPAIAARPDLALLPINGAFGNLDACAAARLADDLQAGCCIPHHFWTFPLHLGNPQQAIDCFPRLAPKCRLLLLTPGEVIRLPVSELNRTV